MSSLANFDPEIAGLIEEERLRQVNGLELIASENVVSRAVLEAMGSIMTNKYAEGYPGKRYYGGCEFHDVVENLARDRLCKLFGAEHANVQPHSGSQANQAVCLRISTTRTGSWAGLTEATSLARRSTSPGAGILSSTTASIPNRDTRLRGYRGYAGS